MKVVYINEAQMVSGSLVALNKLASEDVDSLVTSDLAVTPSLIGN